MSGSAVGRIDHVWDSPFDWMKREKNEHGVEMPVREGFRWWLYKLGFRYLIEYECVEGHDLGTGHLPGWAKSPNAGVVGTWHARRRRLHWGKRPVGAWKPWPTTGTT
jgi:hypothetical protein